MEANSTPSTESAEEILELTRKVAGTAPHTPHPHAIPKKTTSAPNNLSPQALDGLLMNHLKPMIQEHIKTHLPLLIEQTVREEMVKFFEAYAAKSRVR